MREELSKATRNGGNNNQRMVPRPKGTAGTDFSIQEAMGLAGSPKEYDIYKGIQVRREFSQ
jgi:hypothetical protein